MKYVSKTKIIFLVLLLIILSISITNKITNNKNYKVTNYTYDKLLSKNYVEVVNANTMLIDPIIENAKRIEVYDNMTMEELTKKLNKSLNSTLSNNGNIIAEYSIKYKIDPYLATAIILHETGCKWNCSYLVKSCNNVGGIKGSPSCNGSSYKKFESLNIGIKYFMSNLYNNYYAKGLTTVNQINTKYASNTSWSTSINKYILEIKNK